MPSETRSISSWLCQIPWIFLRGRSQKKTSNNFTVAGRQRHQRRQHERCDHGLLPAALCRHGERQWDKPLGEIVGGFLGKFPTGNLEKYRVLRRRYDIWGEKHTQLNQVDGLLLVLVLYFHVFFFAWRGSNFGDDGFVGKPTGCILFCCADNESVLDVISEPTEWQKWTSSRHQSPYTV